MNKSFIKKAFKDIPRNNKELIIKKSCDIIKTYAVEYGVDISTSYYTERLDIALENKINQYAKFKGYTLLGIAADYVLFHIEQFKLEN